MTRDINNPNNDPNKRRTAIVYVLSVLVPLITAPFFIFSDFCKLHPGIVLVLAGVVGEGIEIISKIAWHEQSKNLERVIEFWGAIFWIVVVVGLCWEFREAGKSDTEVALATARAEQANKAAAEAKERTKLAEERIVNLEVQRDQIAKQLAETQLAALAAQQAATSATSVVNNANVAVLQNLQRRLTATQKAALANALKDISSKPDVAFNLNPAVPDGEHFANDIAQALTNAGFKIAGSDVIQRLPTMPFTMVGTFGTNTPADKIIADTLTKMGFPTKTNNGNFRAQGYLYIDIGKK